MTDNCNNQLLLLIVSISDSSREIREKNACNGKK